MREPRKGRKMVAQGVSPISVNLSSEVAEKLA
jgi:hypothetical protein